MTTPTAKQIKSAYKTGNFTEILSLALECNKYVVANTQESLSSNGYSLRSSTEPENSNETRPIRKDLFLEDFENHAGTIEEYLLSPSPGADDEHRTHQRKLLYTIQQSVGAYLDLKVETQASRKIAGEFFQSLIGSIFSEMYTVQGGNIRFKLEDIDGLSEEKQKEIQQEVDNGPLNLSFDLIMRPKGAATKDNKTLTPPAVVCGVKTTTKDRGNMFYIDKYLYQETHKHRPFFIAVVLNDVQRKRKGGKTIGISDTFLPGHNKLYRFSFGPLDGYYFVDPPSSASRELSQTTANMRTIDYLINDDLPNWLNKKT